MAGSFLQAAPPTATRAGILFPVEGNRWLVTIQGRDRDYPPLDQPGFLEFTRSLRSPALYEAIKDAEPIGRLRVSQLTISEFHAAKLAAGWRYTTPPLAGSINEPESLCGSL
jgi:hypothetical protein